MRTLIALLFAVTFATTAQASPAAGEKPIQHFKVAKVTSLKDARKIFVETTEEIKGKKKLNPAELHEIHVITYRLEKSVEYFAENLKGERKQLAKDIAVVVENIHINSENNRPEKTRKDLNHYFKLADKFAAGFKHKHH
ncbi:DUF6746 family protein [Microbulbifer sp. VAAF005]|uniref:DUF6746 family protein n=1 Tax=Microbulbifer sp. VAAF005 TaxID=3034230 RepID=UPI0024ADEFBB|nr:DUF6746 family protein [Microbulbifer sp. VAAF005]WHI45980.1 hypothetical protein P0078_20010 [Microbulbifer sp. VAAF005]